MLTKPQRTAHLVVQSQFLNIMVGPQLFNIIVGPNFSPSWLDHNFNFLPLRQTIQLSAYMAQSQNLQILRTITSGHDVIPTSASFPIWGLLRQL